MEAILSIDNYSQVTQELDKFTRLGLFDDLNIEQSLLLEPYTNKNGIMVFKLGDRSDKLGLLDKITNPNLAGCVVGNIKIGLDLITKQAVKIARIYQEIKIIIVAGERDDVSSKEPRSLKRSFSASDSFIELTQKQNIRIWPIYERINVNYLFDDKVKKKSGSLFGKLVKGYNKFTRFAVVERDHSSREKFNQKALSIYQNDILLLLGIDDADLSTKYTKEQIVLMYEILGKSQQQKIKFMIDDYRKIFHIDSSLKSDIDMIQFIVNSNINIELVAKEKHIDAICCDFDGTLFDNSSVGSNSELNLNEILYKRLIVQEKKGNKIKIITGGNIEQRRKALEVNNISRPLISKADFAGAHVRVVIDNIANQEIFTSKTKIIPHQFINVELINCGNNIQVLEY